VTGLRADAPATVRTRQATMNEISVSWSLEHCRVLWEASGRVIITSTFGDWSHRWTHVGDRTLASFMVGVDRDYCGGKMLGGRYYMPCSDATVLAARDLTLSHRRDGSFTREQARTEWELIDDLEIGETSLDGFVSDSSHSDAWEIVSTRPDHGWVNFWEQLWLPHVVPALVAWVTGESEVAR